MRYRAHEPRWLRPIFFSSYSQVTQRPPWVKRQGRRGSGAAAIDNLMEDAATAEISRAQVWQWLRLKAKLDDCRVVTPELFKATFADEMAKVRAARGASVYDKGRFAEATKLFEDMSLAPTFEEFLTLPAYRLID